MLKPPDGIPPAFFSKPDGAGPLEFRIARAHAKGLSVMRLFQSICPHQGGSDENYFAQRLLGAMWLHPKMSAPPVRRHIFMHTMNMSRQRQRSEQYAIVKLGSVAAQPCYFLGAYPLALFCCFRISRFIDTTCLFHIPVQENLGAQLRESLAVQLTFLIELVCADLLDDLVERLLGVWSVLLKVLIDLEAENLRHDTEKACEIRAVGATLGLREPVDFYLNNPLGFFQAASISQIE